MPSFRTVGLHGYACEFSSFDETRLAVATAQHYGVVGSGRQFVLQLTPTGVKPIAHFDTKDGVYDCAWSEANEKHLASACGDGTVKLWDLSSPVNPVRSFEEHRAEVYSVDWNLIQKFGCRCELLVNAAVWLRLGPDSEGAEHMVAIRCFRSANLFLTGSWDRTIKLWDPTRNESVRTYAGHQNVIYNAVFAPWSPNAFASCSGDCLLNIWDASQQRPVMSIKAHENEILSCDWNKYQKDIIVTGSVDKTIRVWDLRNLRAPISQLLGHKYAVRRVKCSPHQPEVILSSSYLPNLATLQERMARFSAFSEFFDVDGDGTIYCCDARNFIVGDIRIPVSSMFPNVFNVEGSGGIQALFKPPDMSFCVWKYNQNDALLQRYEHHTEFVIGCAFNLFVQGLIAACSWDEMVSICHIGEPYKPM